MHRMRRPASPQLHKRLYLITFILLALMLLRPDRLSADAGFMLMSDRDPHLAINAWGGAAHGTVLRLHNGCVETNPDCTWTYRNGMLLSNRDPSLAINAWGGAGHGTVLRLHNGCQPTNPDCTWKYQNGMWLSDRNPSLAINAWGGAAHGTTLQLNNSCQASNPDCVWRQVPIDAGAGLSVPPSPTCPANQQLCTRLGPAHILTQVSVPATTREMPTGIIAQAGHHYSLDVYGRIRVGVVFEGDTEPRGWYTQGPAGPGFPAPRLFKYGLLWKSGTSGSWQGYDGTVLLKTPQELFFGINDNNFDSNTGAFLVRIYEKEPESYCANACGGGGPEFFPPMSGTTSPPATGDIPESKPCGSQTPDGQVRWFSFDVYCGTMRTYTAGADGCTRAEALERAKRLVGYGCFINEIEGKPIPYSPPTPAPGSPCSQQLFAFCVACDSGAGPFYSQPSAYACTSAEAKTKILAARPPFCQVVREGPGNCP